MSETWLKMSLAMLFYRKPVENVHMYFVEMLSLLGKVSRVFFAFRER
jgi:hypothetical protein